jgi:hypothetical protein
MPSVHSTLARRYSLPTLFVKNRESRRRSSFSAGDLIPGFVVPRWAKRFVTKHPPLPDGLDWTLGFKDRPRILKVESVALNFSRAAAATYRSKRSVQRKKSDPGLMGTARRLVLRAKCFRTLAPKAMPYAVDVQHDPRWYALRAEYCWTVSCLYQGLENKHYRVLSPQDQLFLRHNIKPLSISLAPPTLADPDWARFSRRLSGWDCFFCAAKSNTLEDLKIHVHGKHPVTFTSFPTTCIHCG